MSASELHLFEAIGVEMEYMLVDRETLSVRPISDAILRDASGCIESEIEVGEIAWSNELVLHVIELKTNGPAPGFGGLTQAFARSVQEINARLEPLGAMLMPSAMHPLMDPYTEMRLWPHEYSAVYETFNQIFDCRGHGWANLQSVHLNLPFCGDEEFGRLHAAIRFALPILPALCASSPLVQGGRGPALDSRLEFYRQNARRVPSVSGSVVPEPVFTRDAYERELLGKIYADVAPFDPDAVLRHEWLNARGCIARFDRSAIEIRVLDITECPRSDLAIAEAIVALVRALVDERFASLEEQQRWPTEPLARLFVAMSRDAEQTTIGDVAYLQALGWKGRTPAAATDLWAHMLDTLETTGLGAEARRVIESILAHGCLARRIMKRVGESPSEATIRSTYRELCACLAEGRLLGVEA